MVDSILPSRVRNITGNEYGRLKVISFVRMRDDVSVWLCKCSCGNTVEVVSSSLRRKYRPTRSCGCLAVENCRAATSARAGRSDWKKKLGDTFGLLTLIERVPGSRHPRWLCRCRCGAEILKYATNLDERSSCGCKGEQHRQTGTPTYKCWESMIQRCCNPKHRAYSYYGGRGILVAERWRSFKNFLADMGDRPSLKHTIDRYPDQNGNYEPGNCRWATRKEQQRNTRSNRLVTCGGQTRCLTEWAEIAGLAVHVLSHRLNAGWDPEDAISTPVRQRRKKG